MKNDFIKNKNKSKTSVNQRSQSNSTKKDKNKRIASIILLSLMAFWTICSFLGLSSFLGCNSAPKKVSADSVDLTYEFQGSNLTFQTTSPSIYSGTYSDLSANSTSNFRFSFNGYYSEDESSYKTEVIFTTGYWEQKWGAYLIYYVEDEDSPWESKVALDWDGKYVITQEPTSNSAGYVPKHIYQDFYCGIYNANNEFLSKAFYRMHVKYSNQSYFDANVYKIELGHVNVNTYDDFYLWMNSNDYLTSASIDYGFNYRAFYYNYVRYIDNDGDYIEFQLPVICGASFKPQFLLDERTYFLSQENNSTSSDSYLLGYTDGFDNGKKQGLDEGFIKGEQWSKDTWYREGYYKGLAENNPYTFSSLLGSVIDAPITALFGNAVEVDGKLVRVDGLLNFELLGVNLSTFLGGVLMASLVIAIIKLIL